MTSGEIIDPFRNATTARFLSPSSNGVKLGPVDLNVGKYCAHRAHAVAMEIDDSDGSVKDLLG